MKRPLLIVALLYGGGVLLGDWLPDQILPSSWIAMGSVAGLLCLAWARARKALLGMVLVLAGAANQSSRTAVVAPDDLRVLFKNEATIVTLRGRLTETPYHRVYDHEGESSTRTLAELRVEAAGQQRTGWQRASGIVVVSTSGLLPDEFFGGRMIEVEGVLRQPQGPVVQGQFDYRTYLRRHGIYFQVSTQTTNDWRLAGGCDQPQHPPPADRFSAWAMRVLGLGLPVDEATRLLWAMTLGWKTALTAEVSEPFMRSGTMHIFAISGLHIALIAGILVMVLRAGKVPRSVAGWVVIPLIWIYTGVTGWQASAIRSTVMMTVILFGWMLKRPSDLLNSLAAAALIILVWDPQQLFQASFQLSFCVVLSLALFTPAIDSVRQRVLAEDPFLPSELRPGWQRWMRRFAFWISSGLVTSLAAWLGSIPLVALYFNLFTPASLLANLIVVPLSSIALAANMGSLAVGAFAPGLAELFNNTAWLAMWLMVRISETAGHWGWGCWHVRTPSWLSLALYYAILFAIMGKWWTYPRARPALAIGLALLGAAWVAGAWRERSETRLTAIPLSGGESIFVDAPGRKSDLLIDCGNRSAAEFVLKPFLRSQGIDSFPAVLLTHGDVRNVGGAEFLLRQFPPEAVLMSPVVFRSAAYREMKATFGGRTNLLHTAALGTKLGAWRVMHPGATDHFPQADDNALVLRGEIHGLRLLLCSDLGKPGQHALLQRHSDLRADVVISGVPAQSEPVSGALLEAAQPLVIIITDALYPATARASRRLRERLAEQSARVIYTSESGAVTVVLREGRWRIESASGGILFEGASSPRSAR